MSNPSRGLFVRIFNNFLDSFNVLRVGSAIGGSKGNFVGEDPYGNKYFEIPADPRRGKRRAQRWYNTAETGKKDIVGRDLYAGFDTNLPAEWESWLRHRRDEPPTPDQVLSSLALGEMKKRNAAKLEEARIDELKTEGRYDGPPKPQDHEKPSFPKYADYEVMPGQHEFQKKDKWADFKNPYFDEEKAKPGKKDS